MCRRSIVLGFRKEQRVIRNIVVRAPRCVTLRYVDGWMLYCYTVGVCFVDHWCLPGSVCGFQAADLLQYIHCVYI